MYDQAIKWIKENAEKHGDAADLMRQAKASKPSWYKLLQGKGVRSENLFEWLENLGFQLLPPGKSGQTGAREICFINAKVVPTGEGQDPPQAEDYMAVPLVEEVGAGPGIIPQGELLSWFLVYKYQEAVRFRRNLVAVQIGKDSTSMVPILHPRDVVLVDLDDKETKKPGRIMLVTDPDGSGMIKRVSVEQQNNDYRITYYSDNAAENPPLIYSWRNDYMKDWSRAIAGHVVWAWSDISKR